MSVLEQTKKLENRLKHRQMTIDIFSNQTL